MRDTASPLPSEDPLNQSIAGLRVSGDDLDPAEITALLGHPPTLEYRRGDTRTLGRTGRTLTRKCGLWSLDTLYGHGDFDVQVDFILSRLTADLSIWKALTHRYKVDIFCGFFMGRHTTMIRLKANTLAALSSRGIHFGVCLYAPL